MSYKAQGFCHVNLYISVPLVMIFFSYFLNFLEDA